MILSNIEVLQRYRWLMEEAWTIMRQAERLLSIGAPLGVANQALTGMPRGTNDPTASAVQRYDKYIEQLHDKADELVVLCNRFEEVLSLLDDDRQRDICRKYYAVGMTEEQIAEKLHMDQSTVNRARNEALAKLA